MRTTASAPGGITEPVKSFTAVPRSTAVVTTVPAGSTATIRRCAGAAETSPWRTA